ncbi:MAG: hypothetical protein J1E97_06635 [Muribaculaceae bacterium]|nr:hypothetical protein [Muribaculaceae bacterium]
MRRYIKLLTVALLMSAGFASCIENGDDGMTAPNTDAILIGGTRAEMLATRGGYSTDADGNVEEGIFYLTYPTTDSKADKPAYSRLTADFSQATYYPAYGRSYTRTEGTEAGQELTNSLIGNTPNRMFLDNVDPTESRTANDTLVKFNQNDNPYRAGLLVPEKDFLWGSVQKHNNSNLYDFDLHHTMAGVRVKISVDNSIDGNLVDLYDLSKAEVYITNLQLYPASFSRTTGDVTLAENKEADEKLVLVNTLGSPSAPWGEEIEWKENDATNPEETVYITSEFVLPPQIPSEENWPELVVRFPNPSIEGAAAKPVLEFYGKIPKAMFTNYPEGTNYALDLSFLREHILELRTHLSQNPPELMFMPVMVYDWVSWGPYTVVGQQQGIYSSQQLLDIIDYYKENNTRMLERYGSVENGKWTFNIFNNLKLRHSGINGKMPQTIQEYGVSFQLNSHSMTILGDDGSTLATVNKDAEFTRLLTAGHDY